jgi:hypothetical protein
MFRYVVKFYKKVVAHGHEVDACQYVAEKLSERAPDALKGARLDFCNAHHLCDWTLHADRVEVCEAEYPSCPIALAIEPSRSSPWLGR